MGNSRRFLAYSTFFSTFRQQAAQSKRVQGVVMCFSTKKELREGERNEATEEEKETSCLEADRGKKACKGSERVPCLA
jgi:hypothetical protein